VGGRVRDGVQRAAVHELGIVLQCICISREHSKTRTFSCSGPRFDACPSIVVGCLRYLHRRRGVGGRFRDGVQRAAVHELGMSCSAYASAESTRKLGRSRAAAPGLARVLPWWWDA
jgi:hypothetical protein